MFKMRLVVPFGMFIVLLAVSLFVFAGACAAKEALPTAEDPALERRVMAVAETLRCLVCQNQTIADSRAGLANDLKNQVRQQLKAGASEEAIVDYMVERYGDFVLYRPPLNASTLLLWFGPFALLAAALALLVFHLQRRHRAQQGTTELDAAQRLRAREILADKTEPK